MTVRRSSPQAAKERGITFKAWCVRAMLGFDPAHPGAPAKTSTMRAMNPQPTGGLRYEEIDHAWYEECDDGECRVIRAPYPVGTIFYIRETFRVIDICGYSYLVEWKATESGCWKYLHGNAPGNVQALRYAKHGRWLSGRFMPKWAARPERWRITKTVPMRVRDIDVATCETEGYAWYREHERHGVGMIPRQWFQMVWNQIHSGGWDRNDWVWLNVFKPFSQAPVPRTTGNPFRNLKMVAFFKSKGGKP